MTITGNSQETTRPGSSLSLEPPAQLSPKGPSNPMASFPQQSIVDTLKKTKGKNPHHQSNGDISSETSLSTLQQFMA